MDPINHDGCEKISPNWDLVKKNMDKNEGGEGK